MKIFIDPGHGGTDPGAVSTKGLRESEVNLQVAQRVGSILTGGGITVKYSRETDVYVSLDQRARMANEWGADFFVSIHCNASDNLSANGTETLYFRENSISENMANAVQISLVDTIKRRDRGIKTQNVAVLRLTRMPAILVEMAFISNVEEAVLLGQQDFQEQCAIGITNGIFNFIR